MPDNTATTYEPTEYSRDLNVSSEGRTRLDDLRDLPGSPFANADMKDVYVLAVSYGYQKGRIADPDATGSIALVQRKTLSDEQVAAMEAIAIAHEGTPLVLNDQKRVAKIAQRYMLGGIEALIEHCETADEPRSEFISQIIAAR
ncbi:hypothetical protein [Salinigranum halophilum]|uniref:hypothetical protein n=1 Tax=Salinigranum halophilum TaxID=2565931 RepID=UPI0010A94215|nr:hypothetical protein [Salinigranum halophilum]